MLNWNGRISVAVSTVVMPTSRSRVNLLIVEAVALRRRAAGFRRGRRTTATRRTIQEQNLTESPLRVNAVHQVFEASNGLEPSMLVEPFSRSATAPTLCDT